MNTPATEPGDGTATLRGGTIELPKIGTYKDMLVFLGGSKSYKTVTRWTSKNKLRPGCYVGKGLFNFSQIKYWMDKTGTFLKDNRP